MIRSVQRRGQVRTNTVVDVAPLLDVVFILLIFFLVTATFLEETGVDVERPRASTAQALPAESLRIAIAADGGVFAEGRRLDLAELEQLVRRFLGPSAEGAVVLIPDEAAPAGRLVEVLDHTKRAGATRIAVAARRPGS